MVENRQKEIIRAGIVGIVINLFLVAIKLLVGFLSNSIAIILDGINNLGDAVSSILTIVGTKIAGLPASREHPFGYGRAEYLVSVAIAAIILLTGFSALRESIIGLFKPGEFDYSWMTILVLIVAIIVKFSFGRFCKNRGRQLNAQALKAAGEDSTLDAYVSIGTIVSVLSYSLFRIDIDSIIGVLISILIIKTGFEILKETLGSIIGVRANAELIEKITNEIETFKEVEGVYDLILHDYGPDEMIGSVHIEIEDSLTAIEIDHLTRSISEKIYQDFSVILTIGIYAANNSDETSIEIKREVEKILSDYKSVEQMHGFYVDKIRKVISFDLIISYDEKHGSTLIRKIRDKVEDKYPEYNLNIVRDFDYT